jgi:predicted dehydrogenase
MALSAAQGEAMIAACQRAGAPLFVAYYRRFHPHVQAMRQMILEGRIGRPVQAIIDAAFPAPPREKAGWRIRPEISGGGYFVDVGSHRLDAMVFLLGELDEATGLRTTFDADSQVEQAVCACARFRNGAQLIAMGDYYSGRRADRFAIFGTEGAIVAESFDSHVFQLETRAGPEEFRYEPFPAPHLGLIRHIEDVLLDGQSNDTSGRHALATERILDASARRPLSPIRNRFAG